MASDLARGESHPISDDTAATWTWEGDTAPDLIGDFNGWGYPNNDGDYRPARLAQREPGHWRYTLELPADAYIEYRYVRGGVTVADPLNPRVVWNGVNALNHWFVMPAYHRPAATSYRAAIPHGTLTAADIVRNNLVAGGHRRVRFYQPPTTAPAPLLVVWDGEDFLTRGGILTVIENLMADGAIPPLALALIDHGEQARFMEYSCSDATLAFVTRCVLPEARRRLNLVDIAARPGAYGVLGASMGGLMAFYAGLRLPHIFGHVVAFSSAFGFRLEGAEQVAHDLARFGPKPTGRIWLNAGRYELLLDANRAMRDILAGRGVAFDYHEYNGGHNYTAWRDEMALGLRAVFGAAGR